METNHDGTPIVPDKYETEGQRLSDQFLILRENTHLIDWWQKQLMEIRYAYIGLTHSLNTTTARAVTHRQEILKENQDLKEEIRAVRDRCVKLELERMDFSAALGQLQRDLLAVSERLDGFAKWAGGVEKKLKEE